MKKVFVSHPYGGKHSNMQAISHICQVLVRFGVLPISPIHAFSFLHDNIPEEREKALTFCEELVETCDAVFLTGEWQKSEGCIRERNVALIEMIPLYEVVGWNGDMPLFKGECPKWFNIKPVFKGSEHYREFHESRDDLQESSDDYLGRWRR